MKNKVNNLVQKFKKDNIVMYQESNKQYTIINHNLHDLLENMMKNVGLI